MALQLLARLRVLQRQRGMVREGLEEMEIVLGEERAARATVEVDRADDLLPGLQGHADDRADTVEADALEVAQALVGADVGREHRLAGSRTQDDIPAEGRRVLDRFLFQIARNAHGVLGCGPVAQQDHAALGLDDVERHVEHRFEQGLGVDLGVEHADHLVDRQEAILRQGRRLRSLAQIAEDRPVEKILPEVLVLNAHRRAVEGFPAGVQRAARFGGEPSLILRLGQQRVGPGLHGGELLLLGERDRRPRRPGGQTDVVGLQQRPRLRELRPGCQRRLDFDLRGVEELLVSLPERIERIFAVGQDAAFELDDVGGKEQINVLPAFFEDVLK